MITNSGEGLCVRSWAGALEAAMIKGILVINNHGKPRLTKFYEHLVYVAAAAAAPDSGA